MTAQLFDQVLIKHKGSLFFSKISFHFLFKKIMCVWRGGLCLKRPEGDGDFPEMELPVVVSHLRQFLESCPLEEQQSPGAIRLCFGFAKSVRNMVVNRTRFQFFVYY